MPKKLTTGRIGKKELSQNSSKKVLGELIIKALRDLDDVMGRCSGSLDRSYLLLGELGKLAKEDYHIDPREKIEIDKVEVGIEKRYLTPEALSTLQSYLPLHARFDGEPMGEGELLKERGLNLGISYFNHLPIEVKVINKKWGFFKFPETKFWMYDDYQLPNPWDKYWKARFLIA